MSQTTQPLSTKKNHRFWMVIFLGIIVLIFVAMIGFNIFKSKMTANFMAHLPPPVSAVTVQEVKPQQWTSILKTTGIVRPNQGAMLSAQMPGVVKEILVQAGQTVKKGDVLVRLDSSVEQATLNASKAQLPSVKDIYHRYLKLFKTKSVSRQELDNAKAKYDALVANIKALQATIERRQIVAPFNGVAGIVKVNVGQFINAGTEIVRVEDHSQMKVDFSIAQNNLGDLHLNQQLKAITDAYVGKEFKAKVVAIDPAINPNTGLVDVQAVFDSNANSSLLSGMFTRLKLELITQKNQVVIPQVAVNYNMYGEFAYILQPLSKAEKKQLMGNKVFAYKDKMDKVFRVKQVTVFTLDRQGTLAQLKGEDIKIGDKVVVGGLQNLSNGSLVVVVDKPLIGVNPPVKKTNL